jgi:PAS domain S-box-containing protein
MLSSKPAPSAEFGAITVDAVLDPVWFLAHDGAEIALNPACSVLLGYPGKLSIASAMALIHPDDRAAAVEAWEAAVTAGATFSAEIRIKAADGSYRHMLARAAPYSIEQGAYIGSLTDREDLYFAGEREALLAAANAAFSSYEDPDELIEALLKIIVPRFADYAVVDLFGEDGGFQRFAFAGADAVRATIAASREEYARDGAPIGSSWHVAQTGEPIFVASGSHPAGWPDETVANHRKLGVNSAIVVPLERKGRRLGALSVARTNPERVSFRQPSVAFYFDIAARTATALERTRTIIALQRTETAYRMLADEMPQLIGLTHADGSVFYLNRQHAAYTGASIGTETADWSIWVHPDDRATLAERWASALATGQRLETRYRLRRHDGVYRWFLNQAVPVRDASGAIVSWIGTATDIDELQRRENALRLMADAGEIFAGTLDTAVALQQLAETAARHFADWCGVYLFNDQGHLDAAAVAHVDPEQVKLVRDYLQRYPMDENDGIVRVARTGVPERVGPIPDEAYDVIEDPEQRAFAKSLNLRAIMNVPLAGGQERFGAFSLATTADGRVFDEEDERLATMLAQRAGIVLANAGLFERQRDVARTLQSAFLPASLPQLVGLGLDAAYIPSGRDIIIGGDWYDVDVREDARLTFSIGDVAGHGLDAAIPMGKMRQMFRALPGFADDPAAASIVADAILRREHPEVFVTAFLGVCDLVMNRLTYVNAGHPPPFVREADGTVTRLESAGVPLGLAAFDPPRARQTDFANASLLVVTAP